MTTLYDANGNPIDLSALRVKQATPSITAQRAATSTHPSSGLDPIRLATILRQAELGDPARYLELAEDIEEKDLHYLGVLSQRKRGVAQLEMRVDAASDDAADQANADLIREIIDALDLEAVLFNQADAIGKGYSVMEIIWDIADRKYVPTAIEWIEPKWFLWDEAGQNLFLKNGIERVPLAPYKFIVTKIAAKSGLTVKGGLARPAAWAWMFKNFNLKSWVTFAEAYGQPVRIGKFGMGASEHDKATLLDAVRYISQDFAAIVPDSMKIEFLNGASTANAEIFKSLCDYMDQQISKAVLGQTGTTDAIAGGYAVGKVHNDVRADICKADAKALSAALNRDLVRPIIDLNKGPQKLYPRIRIFMKEGIDIEMMSKVLPALIDRGLKVGASGIRDKMGIPDPAEDEELLQPASKSAEAVTASITRPSGRAQQPEADRPRNSVVAEQGADAPRSNKNSLDDEDEIDLAVKEMLAKEDIFLNEPLIADLEEALRNSNSSDEAMQALSKILFNRNPVGLEALQRAIFTASALGEGGLPLHETGRNPSLNTPRSRPPRQPRSRGGPSKGE